MEKIERLSFLHIKIIQRDQELARSRFSFGEPAHTIPCNNPNSKNIVRFANETEEEFVPGCNILDFVSENDPEIFLQQCQPEQPLQTEHRCICHVTVQIRVQEIILSIQCYHKKKMMIFLLLYVMKLVIGD